MTDANELRALDARALFEVSRPCFHYAPRGTPDGGMFEQSETGRLLMKAMERIAALIASREAAVKPLGDDAGLVAVDERIAEVMAEGDGHWTACTGCQESSDGCVSTTDYPYSAAFKCQPGSGCGECGGIGVCWTPSGFYDGYAEFVTDEMSKDARLETLTRELDKAREALGKIAGYKWPDIIGEHEYSTYGEATGAEYRHKMAVPKEQASGALQSMKAIARAALAKDTTPVDAKKKG